MSADQRRDPAGDRRRIPRGGRRPYDRGERFPTLLVADRHRTARVPYVRYLSRFSFRVAEARDSAEVLEAIEANQPHVILIEPALLRDTQHAAVPPAAPAACVPVIFLVGDGSEQQPHYHGVLSAGVLIKPFSLASMVEEVRRVLRERMPIPSDTNPSQ